MSDNEQMPTEAQGTFACPICGKDTPHYHSPDEAQHHRETEAWVEESLQQFHRDYPQFYKAGEVTVTQEAEEAWAAWDDVPPGSTLVEGGSRIMRAAFYAGYQAAARHRTQAEARGEQRGTERAARHPGWTEAGHAWLDAGASITSKDQPMTDAPASGKWECFRDSSYYDMWCVRPVGSRAFGEGFHLTNADEAKALCELLTQAEARGEQRGIDADALVLREATDVAKALWSQHYREDAPDWKPFDDLRGVISQIDNMACGLQRVREATPPQPEADGVTQEVAIAWLHEQIAAKRALVEKSAYEARSFVRPEFKALATMWQNTCNKASRELAVLVALADIVMDRDEWRAQHENLLSVRQSDLAALKAAQPAPSGDVVEAKDKRRLTLIERIGTITDLASEKPLEGELGDVAYDLLRQAAAQISSDRLLLAALSAARPIIERETVERCRQVYREGCWDWFSEADDALRTLLDSKDAR